MATKADLIAIRSEMATNMALMNSRLEFKIEDSTKTAKQEMIEHIDKFVNHVDAVFVEIKTFREEQAAIAHNSNEHADRLDDHDKRIGKLETRVGGRAG